MTQEEEIIVKFIDFTAKTVKATNVPYEKVQEIIRDFLIGLEDEQ